MSGGPWCSGGVTEGSFDCQAAAGLAGVGFYMTLESPTNPARGGGGGA